MNNQSNINLKVMTIILASLVVGAYFFLSKAPETDQILSVESTNNKADASKMKDESLLVPEKETEQSVSSVQEGDSDEQNTKKINEQTNKQNPPLADSPDELINEQDFPESEPLSIGEFIPTSTPEMIAAEEEYKAASKNYTAPIEAEIQAEFEAFNNEVDASSAGVEIGEFIPVDGVLDNESTEAKEIGEFIQADPELL